MSHWTDERTELLKKLHADGLSASIIGDKLGLTRNAVCGKIDRLGLIGPRRKETTQPRKPRPWRSLNSILNKRAIKTEKIEAPPPSREFLDIPFIDLEPQHCRYPHGTEAPYLFCGQPKMEGSSYCPTCHARCYYKPPRHVETRVFIPRRVA